MKQISQYKFAQQYDIERDTDIVEAGKEFHLTDDLYIIRSTHKSRNYHYRSDGSAGMEYNYTPCWKLMSKNYNDVRDEADEYQMCIMAWAGQRLFGFRREAWRIYGPQNSARYINTNAVFDWLYYTLNPMKLYYENGRLKRGVRGHLITRLNGFAKDSPITTWMLSIVEGAIMLGSMRDED